jgi:serine protease inhibitor
MINKIVDQKEMESFVIILLNTIYFYSEWATKFEVKNTKKDKFFAIGSKKKNYL